LILPTQLVANCQKTAERKVWLANLPRLLDTLLLRWSLRLQSPFHSDATCSWVAPVVRSDGSLAVLKLAMPHMEGRDEIPGLRYWSGRSMVKLLEVDDDSGAMLLEQCLPGTALRSQPEPVQDEIIAAALQGLWGSHIETTGMETTGMETGGTEAIGTKTKGLSGFRPLSQMIDLWCQETIAQQHLWPDAGLVNEGLRVMKELARPAPADVLLATDLHAGNVLRSEREPWLAIDPKPFVGDRAYDPVQHVINCETRLHRNPAGLVARVAGLTEVDPRRLRLWVFARAAADPRDDWTNTRWIDIAKALSR
jgi:streptomycin 6-kinase